MWLNIPKVTIVVIAIISECFGKQSTQDFLNRYNKYNTVCRGMGYETENCKEGIIAFHAQLSATQQNLGKFATVVFGKVTLNSGNAYDPTTGKFTAPKDGIYFFSWTVLTSQKKVFHSEIVLNGIIYGYNHADGKSGSSTYESASSSAIIKMTKRDKVWIRAHGVYGEYAFASWSAFSGFKLT